MSDHHEPSSAPPSARDVLRTMWESRRSEAMTDLHTLISRLESLVDSPDDAELRSRSQSMAHQLVGVFGVFGFTDLKNQMARIDIELSDASVAVSDLIDRARTIESSLP